MERDQNQPGESVCEHIRSLLPAYADGTTTEAQSTEISAHLKQCSACTKCLSLLRQLPEALDAVLPAPDQGLHDRIIRTLRQTPQCPPVNRRRNATLLASMLCFVLLCSALVFGAFNGLMSQNASDYIGDEQPDGNEPSQDNEESEMPGNSAASPDEPDHSGNMGITGQPSPEKPPEEEPPPGDENPDTPDDKPSDGDDEPPSEAPADRPSAEPPDQEGPSSDPTDEPSPDGTDKKPETFRPPLSLPTFTEMTFVRRSNNYWVCAEYGLILITPNKSEFIISDLKNQFAIGEYPHPDTDPHFVKITGNMDYIGELTLQGLDTLKLTVYANR